LTDDTRSRLEELFPQLFPDKLEAERNEKKQKEIDDEEKEARGQIVYKNRIDKV
jgi:hypothetical protein